MRPIRVRFAPSPTGSMHLGSLRTALYNYMFALSSKDGSGRFVLRIEDTDQQRLVPGAVDNIMNDLDWMGITPHESPKANGPYGPYLQSKRLALYQKHANLLVEKGAAYHCFCNERTLELIRKEALRRREVPRYDNRCRILSPADVKYRLASGTESVIRFKLRDFSQPWHDIIYGKISHNVAEVEGDPVILKRDGFPTYHLANVVDDHAMEISHVLRGAEWQTSTPKHLLMFEAFGWQPPAYAHLPLLLNKDGTKLSKRQDDISVASLRKDGFFPEALNCFVLQMGGHFADSVVDCLNLANLAKKSFRLERIGSQYAKIDFDRLYDLNRDILRLKLTNDLDSMIAEAAKIVRARFGEFPNFEPSSLDSSFLSRILSVHFKHRLHVLSDIANDEYAFIWLNPNVVTPQSPSPFISFKNQIIDIVLSSFDETNGFSSLPSRLRSFSRQNCFEFGNLMRDLRLALTSKTVGLPVGDVLQILGPNRTKKRLLSHWK